MPASKKRSASDSKATKSTKARKKDQDAEQDQSNPLSSFDGSCESVTEKIGRYKKHEVGVKTADAEGRLDETTTEVNYRDIALGKEMPWFMKFVDEQERNEFELPQESHGFSKVLTNVHRAHPSLVYSWEDPPVKKGGPPVYTVYTVKKWQSAGVWMDSEGTPCLVIHATYKEKGQPEENMVHMLYEASRRDSRAAIEEADTMDLWAVTDVGTGGHLKKEGDRIVCDMPCKPARSGK